MIIKKASQTAMLFCLVPELVEGNAGASTSSATDKFRVQ